MQKCLIISFDFPKSEYPKTSYAIACILAKFSKKNIADIEHCQYNLKPYVFGTPKNEIEKKIGDNFKENYVPKLNDYSFIALSAYAWSENLVNFIIEMIRPNFRGKIILGGYEITALSKEKLEIIYPNVDFYVKDYVEKSLELIFKNETTDKIIDIKPDVKDFVSPYLSGILPLNTKKIHWESKRGCIFHCDFCEWGKATNNMIRISDRRIDQEIELFKQNNIQEINVLDATFLICKDDITTLKKLLSIPSCKINLQMHFSPIKNEIGSEFLDICQKHKDRISLEFGLQTIHETEMKILNRKNNLEQVKSVMKELKERDIIYEISIIFGIPSQTVETFKKTIEFIEENGCKKFCAFPLRLPQNSKMAEQRKELKIKEIQDKSFSLNFVNESYSFSNSDWETMYQIADDYAKVPLCGDPIEAMKPVIDKIARIYIYGGLHSRFREYRNENTCRNNNNVSIFWRL
ncbi:MAG: radical SAM protein [Prevotellaceae bacterium]|jgi:hypothetical protein|nr:radical SAM protein [Prevotellaceae bacterium]